MSGFLIDPTRGFSYMLQPMTQADFRSLGVGSVIQNIRTGALLTVTQVFASHLTVYNETGYYAVLRCQHHLYKLISL